MPPESTAAIRALLCSTGIPLGGCIVCFKVNEVFLFLVIVIVSKVIIIQIGAALGGRLRGFFGAEIEDCCHGKYSDQTEDNGCPRDVVHG